MSGKWSSLRIIVRDAITRKPMPARIHIKRRDGTCYVAPAERPARFGKERCPSVVTAEHFRDRLHVCQQADVRSMH